MRSRYASALFVLLLSLAAARPLAAAPRDDDGPRTVLNRIVRFIKHLVLAPFSDEISPPKP